MNLDTLRLTDDERAVLTSPAGFAVLSFKYELMLDRYRRELDALNRLWGFPAEAMEVE